MNKSTFLINDLNTIAVVGLGYVGLPLAIAFSHHMNVIGYDISYKRIEELKNGLDRTNEVTNKKLKSSKIIYTTDPKELSKASIIIVAVPTPIDSHRSPDITPVIQATRTVGNNLSKGCIVTYESTVYPGLTEEICIPILEHESGLKCGKDFSIGYSPERINPGDKIHTIENIIKIVSGIDSSTTEILANLYGKIIKAGIYRASSIKVAEAAKVIENTQRDLNIALMNELAIIFHRLGIDTGEVLEAAGTKWNFISFKPGLVGGHCIGVDPYYLTFKAQELGLHPELILAGRRINDGMGKYIAENIVKKLIMNDRSIKEARVGILGLTFKENVPDLRNTRIIDIIQELNEYKITTIVHDAEADPSEAMNKLGQKLVTFDSFYNMDAIVLAVSHELYKSLTPDDLLSRFKKNVCPILIDVKNLYNPDIMRSAGIDYWRL